MFKPTISEIEAVMSKKKYLFFKTGNFNLNLIGIRSHRSKADKFDDTFLVHYNDEFGKPQTTYFPCTTDPGLHYLLHPLVASGTAILVPGQYRNVYKIGIHGRTWVTGGYEALEQIKEMRYVRDNNRDNVIDFDLYRQNKGTIFSAILKTNIHRASALGIIHNIGKYSAGCQVLQDPKDFQHLMGLCRRSASIYGNGFTYTLLEEIDF